MKDLLHIVLLGDSTIDNASYVRGGQPVADHLCDQLRGNEYVTDLARDGAHVSDVITRQLNDVPDDASHLVISVGGNDALGTLYKLTHRADTIGEGIARIGLAVSEFEMDYRKMVADAVSFGLPTTLCTIYNGDFPNREKHVISSAARMFNEVILQTASDHSLPVIDLRQVCDSNGDYYNPIEPSDQGGRKIAHAIYSAVTGQPIDHKRARTPVQNTRTDWADTVQFYSGTQYSLIDDFVDPFTDVGLDDLDDVDLVEPADELEYVDEDGWPIDPTFTPINLRGL